MSEYSIDDSLLKMSMGGASSNGHTKTCKISMLWNWYTIDTCFIARSWRNDTRGKFAGSCIGCFLLVFIAQWLNRVSRQFDMELAKRRKLKYLAKRRDESLSSSPQSSLDDGLLQDLMTIASEPDWKTSFIALGKTMSHAWYFNFVNKNNSDLLEQSLSSCCYDSFEVYPSLLDHVLRALVFTLQWGLSYIIMLLFMYYNGYIIISCLLGALFGRFFFNYEPLARCGGSSAMTDVAHDKEENDRKCCM